MFWYNIQLFIHHLIFLKQSHLSIRLLRVTKWNSISEFTELSIVVPHGNVFGQTPYLLKIRDIQEDIVIAGTITEDTIEKQLKNFSKPANTFSWTQKCRIELNDSKSMCRISM